MFKQIHIKVQHFITIHHIKKQNFVLQLKSSNQTLFLIHALARDGSVLRVFAV